MKTVGVVLVAVALGSLGGCGTTGNEKRASGAGQVTTQSLTDVMTCLSLSNSSEWIAKYRDSGMSREAAVEEYLKTLKVSTSQEREAYRPDTTRAAAYAYSHPSLQPVHVAWQFFTQCRLEKVGADSPATRKRLETEGKSCPPDELKACYQNLYERLR